MGAPQFPEFKPLELADRESIHAPLWRYQPETSELTFTNLYIWRRHYGFQWCQFRDWVFIVSKLQGREPMALQPIGPAPRTEAVRTLLGWLKDQAGSPTPRIERADSKLVSELSPAADWVIEPAREHFDYVYQSASLIDLAGSRYHGKRNHIARFTEKYAYTYAQFDHSHVIPCLELAEAWCTFKRCDEDMDLMDEFDAVKDVLGYHRELGVRGGVVLIEGRVEAFTFGELLNEQTAEIHVEKANPEIPGLYTVINRDFCRNEWSAVPFINREQDLGEPGLRKAKQSYHPVRFIEKFTVRMAG